MVSPKLLIPDMGVTCLVLLQNKLLEDVNVADSVLLAISYNTTKQGLRKAGFTCLGVENLYSTSIVIT